MHDVTGPRLEGIISDDFSPAAVHERVTTGLTTVQGDEELRDAIPADAADLLVVTGTGPVRDLFAGIDDFDRATVAAVGEPTMAEVEALIDRVERAGGPVVGFGGGSTIDVAKRTAAELDRSFIAVPTAGSHDGAFSSGASLYAGSGGGVRKGVEGTPATEVIAPLHFWEEAPYRLWAAGQFDVLANMTALQDVSLACARGKHGQVRDVHRDCSAHALRCLRAYHDEEDPVRLARSLFYSGVSMRSEKGSVYASGFEHELERYVRDVRGIDALHGVTVGLMTLVSAFLYREHQDRLPELYFDPQELYQGLLRGVRRVTGDRETGFGPIIEALRDDDTGLEAIEGIRERHTLRCELDLGSIDLRKTCAEVLEDL